MADLSQRRQEALWKTPRWFGMSKSHANRPQRLELKIDEAMAILDRATQAALIPEDHAKLKAAIDTLFLMTQELESKRTSIERLRKMLFGAKTEKTSQVLGNGNEQSENTEQPSPTKKDKETKPGPKRKGHGRNGVAAYTGANKINVPLSSLNTGDLCPECVKGKIYPLSEPATLVRITGMAPLAADVYECDRMRCNLCGEVFTAPAPEGVGEEKYDETATAMVGQLKYGAGLPFNRIEKLQAGMGIPLPAGTQWQIVKQGALLLKILFLEFIRQAAQGNVLYNDDTTMKILELTAERRAAAMADEETDERTGIFTSGIVSTVDSHKIALFFTGAKHAGENLSDVLAKRNAELPPPIQMCDALSRNTCGEFESIVANCVAHARRKYVEVADHFPVECRYVLETLGVVYKNDATARKQNMSPQDRLLFHQTQSGPIMDVLFKWMKQQFDERKVEPNSGLGEAIHYMQKHWTKLTLFLRQPGAPLDNNICERALKKAILHRKNSLFYKTVNGAHVGDLFMTLIYSAELNRVQPFDYLVAALRHHEQVAAAPGDWMPWNYQDALARLEPAARAGPPASPA